MERRIQRQFTTETEKSKGITGMVILVNTEYLYRKIRNGGLMVLCISKLLQFISQIHDRTQIANGTDRKKNHYTHARGEKIIRCPYRCL